MFNILRWVGHRTSHQLSCVPEDVMLELSSVRNWVLIYLGSQYHYGNAGIRLPLPGQEYLSGEGACNRSERRYFHSLGC